jgi:hypothetical protein
MPRIGQRNLRRAAGPAGMAYQATPQPMNARPPTPAYLIPQARIVEHGKIRLRIDFDHDVDIVARTTIRGRDWRGSRDAVNGATMARRANQLARWLCPCPARFVKIFCFSEDPNQIYIDSRPASQRGGSRSSRTRGGMRWTRVVLQTSGARSGLRSRVVLTPRCWRQVGEKQFSPARVAKKPVARESAKETVKTIARGMPGDSGVT